MSPDLSGRQILAQGERVPKHRDERNPGITSHLKPAPALAGGRMIEWCQPRHVHDPVATPTSRGSDTMRNPTSDGTVLLCLHEWLTRRRDFAQPRRTSHLQNALRPLQSTMCSSAPIVTRYRFVVKRMRGAASFGGEQVCLSASRAAKVSEPGAVAMGSSPKLRLDRVATARRSDRAMRANVRVDWAA